MGELRLSAERPDAEVLARIANGEAYPSDAQEAWGYAIALFDDLKLERERAERLKRSCFEAGHYPNPIGHGVVGCAICVVLAEQEKEQGAKCICYPGHHDMPGGREPSCPAP